MLLFAKDLKTETETRQNETLKTGENVDGFHGWNAQVSQVPESSEGKPGHGLDLIALDEPAKDKCRTC